MKMALNTLLPFEWDAKCRDGGTLKKLLIWGTGRIAEQFIKNGFCGELLGFVETHKTKDFYMGKPVFDSQEMPGNFDYIIVANTYGEEIYHLCLDRGMDMSKIIFLFSIRKREGCTDISVLQEVLQGKNYNDYCLEYGLFYDSFLKEDIARYEALNRRPNFNIQKQYMWPVINNKYEYAGTLGNYFLQDLWAARQVIRSGIKEHFDIGSRLDYFIAHLLAADIDVTMIDVREFPGEIENLHTIVDDATSLRQVADDSIESMSALCSLEHFGLGRYGDPIDPEACFKCFSNIQKKLKSGGRFYLSLPVGKERVEFNAHRVFYASTVIDCFHELQLQEFSCACEGKVEYHVDIHKYDQDTHNGEYRYGLFSFVKA